MMAFPTDLKLASELLHAGLNPFWSERLSCGTPLFATSGLGLGYPGTLLALHAPIQAAWLACALFHAALGFEALRRLHPSRLLPFAALAAPFLGPGWGATLAWLAWVLALEKEGRSAAAQAMAWCFAILSGGAGALLAFVVLELAIRRSQARSLAAGFGLGLLLASGWVLPALEGIAAGKAQARGPEQAAPEPDPLVLGRGERVALAPGQAAASHPSARSLAARGLHLSWGARREAEHFSMLQRLLEQGGPESSNILSAMGAAWTFDGKEFKRHRAPARVAWVDQARLRGAGEEALKLETAPLFQRALILEEPAAGLSQSAGGAWTLLSERPGLDGSLKLKLPLGHGNGWLYSADSWYPGWEARVDGKKRELVRAERGFRALRVAEDEQEVLIRYLPLSFQLGLGLCLACLLFLLRPRWFRRLAWGGAGH